MTILEQLPMFPAPKPRRLTSSESRLLAAYQRITSGLCDESGRVNPDGARKTLSVAQAELYESYLQMLHDGLLTE